MSFSGHVFNGRVETVKMEYFFAAVAAYDAKLLVFLAADGARNAHLVPRIQQVPPFFRAGVHFDGFYLGGGGTGRL
jgi:hypothetical protein